MFRIRIEGHGEGIGISFLGRALFIKNPLHEDFGNDFGELARTGKIVKTEHAFLGKRFEMWTRRRG